MAIDPTDLWVYPRWPALTGDMIFFPVWPVSPTQPHYVSLAQLATYINPGAGDIGPGLIIGNPNAVSGPAIPTSLSSIIDRGISAVQGSVLYRSATAWVALPPATANYVLATRGAGADPHWAEVSTLLGGGPGIGPVTTSDVPPASPLDGDLWWDTVGGQLYVWYDDGTSAQWVAATNEQGSAGSAGGVLPSGIAYDQLTYLSGSWAGYRPRYIMACFVPGTMASTQYLLVHRVSKAVTFPANFTAYMGHTSQARGTANATASTEIVVQRALSASPGTFTTVGTITIAAGSMVGTLTTSGGTAVAFAQGDSLALVGPVTPDATFTNFAATLVGYET